MLFFQNIIKNVSPDLSQIAHKVQNNLRISKVEALLLFERADLGFVGMLADYIRKRFNGEYAYFNHNFHIEPTNICLYDCKFCSFSKKNNDHDAWDYSIAQMREIAKAFKDSAITEVHIVGGVYPKRSVDHYCDVIQAIREILPKVHIKAYSAVEIHYMAKQEGTGYENILQQLKESGLNSLPGGGAEIFVPDIRKKICPSKVDGDNWLKIHEAAHKLNIPTNATMLYGHIENYIHRLEHLEALRNLQDKTGGFNAFIPLKFCNANNSMSHIPEKNSIEDLKNYAISRIFLDNFRHIKAYWPMIGKSLAQIALSFGVDDIDGTIGDTTKIYTMARNDKTKPVMTTSEIIELIRQSNRMPAERNSIYEILKTYK